MANEKLLLIAEARKLDIDGYRKMSADELRTAIASAKGTTPSKGKGKTVPASEEVAQTARTKGKTTGASANGSKGKTAASKTSGSKTAKQAPAKSTAQKTTAKSRTAAQGTAKRPATGGTKGKTSKPATAAKTPRSRKQAEGRVSIDNASIDWKAESNVGTSGKRKEVLDALRKHKGDKIKVFNALAGRAKSYYPAKSKDEAERMLVWLIGRVAYDFVFKTGQHEPGTRAAYGTSDAAQDVRRREQRAAEQKAAAKAARAAKRKPAGASTGRGKTSAARGKGKARSGR